MKPGLRLIAKVGERFFWQFGDLITVSRSSDPDSFKRYECRVSQLDLLRYVLWSAAEVKDVYLY